MRVFVGAAIALEQMRTDAHAAGVDPETARASIIEMSRLN